MSRRRLGAMSELATIRTFYRFNAAERRRYLETILALPKEEQLKDRGASYPSLLEIYVHVLDSLRFWFQLVPQDRATDWAKFELSARELTDERLRQETEAADQLVSSFLTPLHVEDLAREVVCHFPDTTGKPGPEQRFLIGDVLWHMVEEEFQHRGELNALLWQIDVDPPIGTFELWKTSKAEGMYAP
jgi:uncharacterized damage-inducible protein DinB